MQEASSTGKVSTVVLVDEGKREGRIYRTEDPSFRFLYVVFSKAFWLHISM